MIELLSFVPTNDQGRNKIVDQLKELKNELFGTTSPEAKKKKRGKIDDLIKQLFEYDRNKKIEELQSSIYSVQSQKRLFEDERDKRDDKVKIQKIESKIKEIKDIKIPGPAEHFEWHISFSEVFQEKEGFDVVIANPPYVSYYSRESAKTKDTEEELQQLRDRFVFTRYEKKTGRLNLWMFFAEKFITLLKNEGVSSFIVDVNFTKDLAKNIRRYLIEHIAVKQFIHDLSEFEYVASGQVILIVQKANVKNQHITIKKSLDDSGLQILQSNITGPDYNFLKTTDDLVVSKLSKESKLEEFNEIKLTTGVQISGIEKYKGVPVKDYFYRKDWDYKKVFPSVLVKSVQRYAKPELEKGILFDYDLATEITKSTKKSAFVLNKYKEFLDKEKIFIRQSAPAIIATLGEPNTCGEYSLFSLISFGDTNLKYILALLNSKTMTYFATKQGVIIAKRGTQPQIRKSGLGILPIKKVTPVEQKPFIDLVDKILAITKTDDYLESPTKQAKVREYEKQIDQMVYKLYGLTPEEIEIIEGLNKNKS